MNTLIRSCLILAACGLFSSPLRPAESALPNAEIEAASGLKGTWIESEHVFKVTRPRRDIPVAIDGRVLPPFMGFTSWVAFTPGMKSPAMAMGDVVLFEDEVDAAMSAALDGGLSVTALHNHFFYDEPKVYFMHVNGEGDAVQMARTVKSVFDRVDAIRGKSPKPQRRTTAPELSETSAITAAPLESVLKAKPTTQSGMAKFVWGRTVQMECGCPATKEMGVNTWAAFYGQDDNAAVCGDFAVLETELQPVLKSLRGSGISVVAIHHHMTTETPRLLFLHYWGRGAAAVLSKSLRAALDLTPDAQ